MPSHQSPNPRRSLRGAATSTSQRNSRKRNAAPVSPDGVAGKGKTTRKNGKTNDPLPDDDNMSVDTPDATNESTTLISTTYASFLSFQVTVSECKQGTSTMRTQFQNLFKIIKDADPDAVLSHYKTTTFHDNDGNLSPMAEKNVVIDAEDIPDSVTAMGKYFFGARPNSKGGSIWTQIRLLHDVPIDNIIADTREDFIEKAARLTLQPIQHWDVVSIGFLKNVHPDVDVNNLNHYLCEALTKQNRGIPLLLGLKVKTPWDGKKRDTKAPKTNFRDRIQAVHCECEGAQKSLTARLLKVILSSATFQLRYKCDARLVPTFDRNSSPHIQEKIRRCIVQHGQFCKCVNSNTCEGIEFLDVMNETLQKTLRQLILALPDAHFINVDLNWSNTGYSILYPKKYETAALERIANLGPYLHRAYGDPILVSLPADTQELIHEVTWDDKTGRPLTKLDRELDDILENGSNMEYVDLTMLATIDERPDALRPSNTFIPDLDNGSISTFGTVKTKKKQSPSLSRKRSTDNVTDSSTVFSEMTIDTLGSRVTNMETDFSDMKAMLQILVARKSNDSTVAQPPAITTAADASQNASADGV